MQVTVYAKIKIVFESDINSQEAIEDLEQYSPYTIPSTLYAKVLDTEWIETSIDHQNNKL